MPVTIADLNDIVATRNLPKDVRVVPVAWGERIADDLDKGLAPVVAGFGQQPVIYVVGEPKALQEAFSVNEKGVVQRHGTPVGRQTRLDTDRIKIGFPQATR